MLLQIFIAYFISVCVVVNVYNYKFILTLIFFYSRTPFFVFCASSASFSFLGAESR